MPRRGKARGYHWLVLFQRIYTEEAHEEIPGAGARGASTVFYLHRAYPCLLDVTIYGREDFVAGRSMTVSLYGDADEQVELGASIFVDINHNLVSAVEHFNLSTADYGAEESDGLTASLGVWNGKTFVFMQNEDSYE